MLSFRDAYLEKPETKKIKLKYILKIYISWKSLCSLNINDLAIEINFCLWDFYISFNNPLKLP